MGEGSAVSKCPSDPRSGLTCIVRLWESTFALRAINEQTFLNLRTTEHASENVRVARHLRRQRSKEFLAKEKRRMDNTIWQTHTAVQALSKLLEPARVDRVDMYGDEKISLSTKGLWVLNDSPDVAAAFDQVQVAHEALDEVIGSLSSPRKPDSVPPTKSVVPDILLTASTSRPTPYDSSQLLAWRRQSRMNLRRDTVPLKTEGLGVRDPLGAELAIIPPDSHSINSTSLIVGAGARPGITSQSRKKDESQELDEVSVRKSLSGLSEAQFRIPLKSPSRVSLQTQYPSPPQSDTGSSPRVHNHPASPPLQNQYYSPPQSSRGNSPQSQHQASPQNRSRAPLQDQQEKSLQIESQNMLQEKPRASVGNQYHHAATKHFAVMSEVEYPPQLPSRFVPPQNPTEHPPERQYHLPPSLLARTRSTYRENTASGDRLHQGLLQGHQDQQTPPTPPTQAFPQTEVTRQQLQHYQASPHLRFLEQQNHKQSVPPYPHNPLQYHNPGPFFLGERERPKHSRSSSEPTYLPTRSYSRGGYRLPMVFEENLYGGLEVVSSEHPNPVTSGSLSHSHSQTQPHDAHRGVEVAVADAELESVSTNSRSQHDLVTAYSSHEPANAPSVSEDELRDPYQRAQSDRGTASTNFQPQQDASNPQSRAPQELMNTYSASQPDLGNTSSRAQQQPVVTTSQYHYDLGNPYLKAQQQQQPSIITHSQSQYDLGNPYWRPLPQQEDNNINTPSQPQPRPHPHPRPYALPHSLGNSYTRPQPDPPATSSSSVSKSEPQYGDGIKHTQSLNEANNPYARSNKRKSWLAWQASRSVTARGGGLNDRYSL